MQLCAFTLQTGRRFHPLLLCTSLLSFSTELYGIDLIVDEEADISELCLLNTNKTLLKIGNKAKSFFFLTLFCVFYVSIVFLMGL